MKEYTEDNEPYCTNCGAEYEDLRVTACPANGTVFKCSACDYESIWPDGDIEG